MSIAGPVGRAPPPNRKDIAARVIGFILAIQLLPETRRRTSPRLPSLFPEAKGRRAAPESAALVPTSICQYGSRPRGIEEGGILGWFKQLCHSVQLDRFASLAGAS